MALGKVSYNSKINVRYFVQALTPTSTGPTSGLANGDSDIAEVAINETINDVTME